MAMELPDEAISFDFQGCVTPTSEDWSPAAELRARHFVSPQQLKDVQQRLLQCRSQILAEREIRAVPPEQQPLQPGFIDLPQQHLDAFRRKGDESELGVCINLGQRLRDDADTVVFLGSGGAYTGPRALFDAFKPAHHNELPATQRSGIPRVYFQGESLDSDSLQDLFDLLQLTCIDPENREERWAVVLTSKSGQDLESASALRLFRREANEYYGLRSPWLKRLFVGITGSTGPMRNLFIAQGHDDEEILTLPGNVATAFGIFTPAGLVPAAVMGLDVRALLLGAAAMTRRFVEEPFERNPVLQFAAVNHLLTEDLNKPLRVMSFWSRRLTGVGTWYEQLAGESLAKQGRGPLPVSSILPRDRTLRGQQMQEGQRDRIIHNVVVKTGRGTPLAIQMNDRNEDDLNQYNRKSLLDLAHAAHAATKQTLFDTARPTTDLILPNLTEHTVGQLLQMLMLATVVEARLMGVNPYATPAVEAQRRAFRDQFRQGKPATEEEETR